MECLLLDIIVWVFLKASPKNWKMKLSSLFFYPCWSEFLLSWIPWGHLNLNPGVRKWSLGVPCSIYWLTGTRDHPFLVGQRNFESFSRLKIKHSPRNRACFNEGISKTYKERKRPVWFRGAMQEWKGETGGDRRLQTDLMVVSELLEEEAQCLSVTQSLKP